MKALVQRVVKGSVTVDGEIVGSIGRGLVVLAGVGNSDTEKDVDYLAEKVANLRIFSDAEGKFNLSALDIGGEILVISQFTLLADTKKGRRPSFTDAAPPDYADRLINLLIERLRTLSLKVATGRFQAHMLVEIHNDGPVTIMLNSRQKFPRDSLPA
ncbi:MAG: D-aminoacyl-tRNA deacylase [Chloroflexota bacterium]